MNTTTFSRLKGVAVKGDAARPARHEAFIKGVIRGDNMTLLYRSQSRVPKPGTVRKLMTVTHNRQVFCQRVWADDHSDFWWEAKDQINLTLPA